MAKIKPALKARITKAMKLKRIERKSDAYKPVGQVDEWTGLQKATVVEKVIVFKKAVILTKQGTWWLPGYDCPDGRVFSRVIVALELRPGTSVVRSVKRTNAHSDSRARKCRADYAKVLAFYGVDGKPLPSGKYGVFSYNDNTFRYQLGRFVTADHFDDSTGTPCAAGIHYFERFRDAVRYNFT